MNKDPLLKASNINVYFDKGHVLQNINLDIRAKEIVTLIGPNGSGKSTLAKVILGLIKPSSGEIIRSKGLTIGYMPQKIYLDNVMPLKVKNFLGLFVEQNFDEICEEIAITHLLNRALYSLSGGELQRVMLARSILKNPNLLVLDEPVQGVDITGQLEFYALIERIRDNRGTSIFVISHDLYMVMKASDQVICLNQHVCCQGAPSDLNQQEIFRELFGIDASKIAIYSHHHDHSHSISHNILAPKEKQKGENV
jgi:zinc transport system ATP-binding protein